jgi:glycerol dehydrogenase
MAQIMIAPNKYVQGPGAIREIGPHVAALGKTAIILGSKSGFADVHADLEKALADAGVSLYFEQFQGECSRKEIDRVNAIVKAKGGDVVLAVGGGKCIDTGKAVAHECKVPIVVIPTIASTDAPCSALTVTYTEDHVFESYYVLPKNPDMVVLDTEVIARSPARFLVSGMGDALATWFEADACRKAFAKNMPGGDSTEAALALARLCYELLMRFGRQAKAAAEVHAATVALDKITEANTLLSGLGFESSGLAAAHAVHDGLTALPECHHLFHGEKVAFGTLTQLVLENREMAELEEVMDFCTDVGLPITLAELGVTATGAALDERVMLAAQSVSGIINNEPFPVTTAAVAAAIKGADGVGRAYFAKTGKMPAKFENAYQH